MNRLYKTLLLTVTFLFAFASFEANAKRLLPEEYTNHVKGYFAEEQWEEGKRLLDEGIEKYPQASNLHWLMGRYWFFKKNYDKSRYHLIKAVELNYNNVEAKQLLVDVEDVTKNYSSAICYVNELLEVNPYWRGLWRRKIELYRKQGNEVEANRLLKRINQIYPNDSTLRNDYIYSVEVQYQKSKKEGNRRKAIEALQELLRTDTANEEYYVDLVSLYLMEGNKESALDWCGRGMANVPKSTSLVAKKASILSELGRYHEALSLIKEARSKHLNSPELNKMYNAIVLEAANTARQNDPYTLYGIAYQNGDRSNEVLDNLINLSIQRGYHDDALFYLRESKRRFGQDKSTLYKEYIVYKAMGEETKSFNLLYKLCALYPNDEDLMQTLCAQQLERANRFILNQQYNDALTCAAFVTRHSTETETDWAAWNKVLTCRIQLKQYDTALSTIDTMNQRFDRTKEMTLKRATVLNQLGRTKEALDLLSQAIDQSDADTRLYFVNGYSEISLPYIKQCMEIGATNEGFQEAKRLLELEPNNDQALRYALNGAGQLGYSDLFLSYTEQGLARYPKEPFYQVKRASIYDNEKQYKQSLELLYPSLHYYSGNFELTNAFAQSSEYRALELIKENRAQEAITVIDTALIYSPNSKSLRYTKGLAYEKMKLYDQAYEYQKHYLSSNIEEKELTRQLKGLQRRMMKHEIGLLYLQSRYGETDAISSVATGEYTYKSPKDDYTGRLNYAGRDGTSNQEITDGVKEIDAGGVGIQLQGEWTHLFSSDWQTMINAAWANKYFPTIMANAAISKYLKNDWEVELRAGYRRLENRNLFSIGPGVSKSLGNVWFNSKVDLYLMNSKLYYNAMAQTKLTPFSDRVSNISAMIGIGSAPELTLIDQALSGSFDQINTMVGLGGQWMMTQNLSVGVTGTWHTYYMEQLINNQEWAMRYKNRYNVYVQIYYTF